MLTKVQLLTLAQTAQRQGLSRGSAYRAVSARGVSRERWEECWRIARKVELVFGRPPAGEDMSAREGKGS